MELGPFQTGLSSLSASEQRMFDEVLYKKQWHTRGIN